MVWAVSLQLRETKTADRVEISPMNLAAAALEAEDMSTREPKVQTNVVGWYHSHPKITVPPSHVGELLPSATDSNRIGSFEFGVRDSFDKGR